MCAMRDTIEHMTTTPISDQAEGQAAPRRRIPADTFAARLVLARQYAGNIPIREAAEQCGLNYGSWAAWERGAMPRNLLDAVDKIHHGLDVDREWLLFGGPLAEAEENRRRWSGRAGSSTHEYARWPGRQLPVVLRLRTQRDLTHLGDLRSAA